MPFVQQGDYEMIVSLFLLFVFVSLSMILWGLQSPERVFQFPFLAGSVWLFYIGPLALAVVINPHWIPIGAQNDHGIEMALFMASLCASFSFIGYLRPLQVSLEPAKKKYYAYQKLFVGGCLLIAIAYFGLFKVASLCGGFMVYYSAEGNYHMEWVGLPVAYVFFVTLIYPGLMLCLLATLRKRTVFRLIAVLLGALLPLCNILFLGRRAEAVLLVLTVGLCFFFQRQWAPKRSLAVGMVIFGGFMVIVMPVYRDYTQLGADYSKIITIDPRALLRSQVMAETPSEFVYPVVQLAATQHAMKYNYGLGFYNRFVKEMVPSLLVGRDFKNTLFIDGPDFAWQTQNYYAWEPQYGWIPTGITDVFREFGFFGALLFFLVGRGFRFLWEKASYYEGHLPYKILYIAFLPESMLTITHGITQSPFKMTYMVLFLMPIILFSRVRLRDISIPR